MHFKQAALLTSIISKMLSGYRLPPLSLRTAVMIPASVTPRINLSKASTVYMCRYIGSNDVVLLFSIKFEDVNAKNSRFDTVKIVRYRNDLRVVSQLSGIHLAIPALPVISN